MSRPSYANILSALLRRSLARLSTDLGAPFRRINLQAGKVPAFFDLDTGPGLGSWKKGQSLLEGHFRYAGQELDVGTQGDLWSLAAPSERFAFWLHGFSWIEDLAALNDPSAIIRARFLVDKWISVYGRWNTYAWNNAIIADRLFSWLSVWSQVLSTDSLGEAAVQRRSNTIRQLKRLRQTYNRTPEGMPKFKAAAVLALGGAHMTQNSDGFLDRGLDLLDVQIEKQILPDGGHVSRSPDNCIVALRILLTLDKALEARGVSATRTHERALERLKHIIPFFNMGDAGQSAFHGSGEGDRNLLDKLSNEPTRPFQYCPHTGYQRLHLGDTIMIVDTGQTPPYPYDKDAHLSPLAFELATKAGRLIVNCGWNDEQPLSWRDAVRKTPAHSTLTINGENCGKFFKSGAFFNVLSDHVKTGVDDIKSTRREQPTGVWLEAHHNGYLASTGLVHRRRLYVKNTGQDIRGEDSLLVPIGHTPSTRKTFPFEIRFHLHPQVRATLAQDLQSALLIQPGNTGWRFRTDGGPLTIEDSVYLSANASPVKTQQIVIKGNAFGDSDGETKSNRVKWSLRRLEAKK